MNRGRNSEKVNRHHIRPGSSALAKSRLGVHGREHATKAGHVPHTDELGAVA